MEHPTKIRPGRPTNDDIRSSREEEILLEAGKLFAECGYAQADTQTLANRLGVGKGTLYRYFNSKQELFLAAVDRQMRELDELVAAIVAESTDPFTVMYRCIYTYLKFYQERPQFVELLIQERANFKDRPKTTYFQYREKNSVHWREAIEQQMAMGELRKMPSEQIADVLGDLLYGTMLGNYFANRKRSPIEQAGEIFDIALFGILSDSEREKQMRQKIDRMAEAVVKEEARANELKK